MKINLSILVLFSLLFSSSTRAQDESEIKIKDLNQQSLNTIQNSMPASENATISPEQLAELQKQMAGLKEKQEESKKLLEELDKE